MNIAIVRCELGRGRLKYVVPARRGRAIQPNTRDPMFGIHFRATMHQMRKARLQYRPQLQLPFRGRGRKDMVPNNVSTSIANSNAADPIQGPPRGQTNIAKGAAIAI